MWLSLPGLRTQELLWSVSHLDTDLCSCAELHVAVALPRACVYAHTRARSRLRLAKTVFTRDIGLQFSCDVCLADPSIALTSRMLWDLPLLSAVQRSPCEAPDGICQRGTGVCHREF